MEIASLFVDNSAATAGDINYREIDMRSELFDFLGFTVVAEQIEFTVSVRQEIQPVFRPDRVYIVGASFRLRDFFY